MSPIQLPGLSGDERFELLVNAVTDYAIYMLDPLGRVATWNAGAARLKGYSAAEIEGQHFSIFFSEDDRAAGLPGRALEIAAKEGRFEAEGWRIRKDGSRFWANTILDPARDKAGELVGFAKITRDISDRKAAEEAMRDSERRFRLLVEGVKDYAIYMLDPIGILTNWNAGAQAIKGYLAEDVIGRHFSMFYTEEERAACLPEAALDAALADGRFETDGWRVRKDGTLFWANVVIDPIYDEAGAHIGFAKITRDMSERRRVEAELDEARTSLLQSQKLHALGELTGGIAHDFNNLMTVVAGSTELLLKQPDLPEAKRRRYLEAIAETAARASTLTGHLLAFSRKRALRPEVIDLNVRLDALQDVMARTLGSRIAIQVRSETDARIEVDVAELETAVLNAAVNARDAMPNGGTLKLTTKACLRENQAMLALEIADSGTGMPPDVLERVFEPFFTTKPVGSGTGLGLSQIHGFAAQAGGSAEVESTVGEGTVVRILLPRVSSALSPPKQDVRLSKIPHGLRVLLAEDNLQVLQFATDLLTDIGCRVFAVSDAHEAGVLLQAQPVDLVFSDIIMPGMSGVDFARKLRVDRPELPVLLASGYSAQIVGASAAEFHLLAKPYGAGSLSMAISKVLAEKRAEQV